MSERELLRTSSAYEHESKVDSTSVASVKHGELTPIPSAFTANARRHSIDVARLSADLDEQAEFARQIERIESSRLLIVFDQELTLRLVDGNLMTGEACHELVNAVGLKVGQVSAFAKEPKVLGICAQALKGEQNTAFIGCYGRQFGLRAVPLRSRNGQIAYAVGIVRELSDESTRDGVERRLFARLRALVDSMDSGIIVEDENNVIQQCNQHFCNLMQLDETPQDLIGCSSPVVVERVSRAFFIPEALAEGIDELKKAGKVVKDELVYLADMRILERSYSPLELDGTSVGHLWTYRDVTDRERNKDLLQRQADELRALSLVDELTGLYNRRGFLTISTQQLKLCDRSLRSALVVFVDLDGMKRINDELGHEYGDQALIETANVLRQCFRYSDVVARLGGDEFVVLAVEADPPIAEVVVERLYEKLAEMNAKPNRKFELKFSVGIAPYDPAKSEMVEEVLARADSLMYEQKRLRKCERKD